jgi:hypothetical protein
MTPSPFSFGRLIGERDNITQLSHSVRDHLPIRAATSMALKVNFRDVQT